MRLLWNSYVQVLKKDFMLAIIAIALLFFTFFMWAGFPIFFIAPALARLTANLTFIYVAILFLTSLLFTLYFLPINLKVARHIATVKNRNSIRSFIRIEILWIVIGVLILELFLRISGWK